MTVALAVNVVLVVVAPAKAGSVNPTATKRGRDGVMAHSGCRRRGVQDPFSPRRVPDVAPIGGAGQRRDGISSLSSRAKRGISAFGNSEILRFAQDDKQAQTSVE